MGRSTRRLAATLGVLSLVIAACSGAATPAPTAAPTAAPTGGATAAPTPAPTPVPAYLEAARAMVEEGMRAPTFEDIGPKTPAPPFAKGLKIAVLIATARSTGAQLQAGGVKAAATAVGWTVTEFDGAGSNEGRLAAFRTILTQDFDGIVLVATDQRVVGDAMKEAAARGIPVVSTMAGNDESPDPTHVFAEVGMDDLLQGHQAGNWIITDAAARGEPVNALLFLNPVNRTVELRDQGVQEALAACTDCTVVAAETYTSKEVFQTVPQRAQAILQQYPETNYIMIDVGAYAVYAVQGVKQLGQEFADRIRLVSFDCVPDEVSRLIAGDVEAACTGAASEAAGWGAIDELNRALNGQPPSGVSVPIQLITIDNYAGVTTGAVGYTGPFDYKTAYKAFWADAISP